MLVHSQHKNITTFQTGTYARSKGASNGYHLTKFSAVFYWLTCHRQRRSGNVSAQFLRLTCLHNPHVRKYARKLLWWCAQFRLYKRYRPFEVINGGRERARKKIACVIKTRVHERVLRYMQRFHVPSHILPLLLVASPCVHNQ